jgi:hypothetical protein
VLFAACSIISVLTQWGATLPTTVASRWAAQKWRATLKAGQPPDEYRARPPTPAAQPLASTRARRSTATTYYSTAH